jgi:hypothetical protein
MGLLLKLKNPQVKANSWDENELLITNGPIPMTGKKFNKKEM